MKSMGWYLCQPNCILLQYGPGCLASLAEIGTRLALHSAPNSARLAANAFSSSARLALHSASNSARRARNSAWKSAIRFLFHRRQYQGRTHWRKTFRIPTMKKTTSAVNGTSSRSKSIV